MLLLPKPRDTESVINTAPPDNSQGCGKKILAANGPVAPRYSRLSETDLGEKSHFFNCGRYRNFFFGGARIQR